MDYKQFLNQVRERRIAMLARRKRGDKLKDIARDYGVSVQRVQQITSKKGRAHEFR